MIKRRARKLLIITTLSSVMIGVVLIFQQFFWEVHHQLLRPLLAAMDRKKNTSWPSLELNKDDVTVYLCEPMPPLFGRKMGLTWPLDDYFNLCPEAHVLTVEQGGRLGNQMWEYASVWALAQELEAVGSSLRPFVPHCLRRVLDDAFPYLSVPELHVAQKKECAYGRKPESMRALSQQDIVGITAKNKSKRSNILLKKWITLPEFVIPRIQQLREKDFLFRDEFIEDSRHILYSVANNLSSRLATVLNPSDIIYVGVHVRRTDYYYYLTHKILKTNDSFVFASASFFHRAMEHFRTGLKPYHTAFLVVSDDVEWCLQHLTYNNVPLNDVFVVTRDGVDEPLLDLSLLASCNHSIIDYGTFGVWGALLAGGNTLVYRLPGLAAGHTIAMTVAQAMPTWTLFPP